MAKETVTKLVDDLDGGTADRTVVFAWDGTNYEIDLSRKNISGLEKAFKPYLSAARTVRATGNSRRRGSRAAAAPRRRNDLASIRDWARTNGHAVSDRGRIARSIVEAYESSEH